LAHLNRSILRLTVMNFDYSDEQISLKREARRFLDARCPVAAVHELSNDGDRSYDRNLWTGIAELGWLGATIPENHGGLGLGYIELCAIAEELGRALAPVPVASTLYFFVEALLLCGSPAQQSHWLPRVAAGRAIGCLATSEGPGRIGARSLAATVEGGRLTGVKIPVTDGEVADVAIVLAAESGAPGLFIVELEQPGVERERLASLDATRGIARVIFCAAPAARLGAPGAGLRLLEDLNNRAAVLLAFEQLGGADRCLEAARDYALQRYAFGRQVGAYQAIKHRLADMYVKNEVARSTAYYAAWALNANAAELPVAAAAARLAASDAFGFAARENIQVHGGMGFTREADAHLYFRRARQLSLVAGSPASWGESLVCALSRRFPRAQCAAGGA
jgi:alkylation response protein AidB-like acyl-CoA dehydrogenase